MGRLIILLVLCLTFSGEIFAHQAFTLVSSEAKAIREADVAALEKQQTVGIKAGTNLSFSEREIHLVVITGPEDDMLSYRIQGMRNPTLAVPSGALLKILFVNADADMRHDLRFGHMKLPLDVVLDTTETAGSNKLSAGADGGVLQAEEIVVRANEDGQYVYFCSVRGHAKGGMWGNIAVGVKPGADMKMPEKTKHVHSKDEEDGEMKDMPGMNMGGKKPAPTPTPTATPHDHKKMMDMQKDGADKMDMQKDGADKMDMDGHSMKMSSTIDIGDPMNREGSGTSWIPDSSPMHAYMRMYKDGGMLMLMGTGFLRYTQIGSDRDVSVAGKGSRSRVSAPTMFMAMYTRPLTSLSQLGLRATASLDPVIERGWGYPLLYQSGELYRGEPIHDRQHPHDFISELAATYSYKVNERQSFFVYGGIVGEPALGPPMFLHRTSGMNNPDAPIGHHWQDASHITWGVVTAGYNFGKFKIEASAFNGTEPDENRWAFDTPRLNSFSARFSFNPTKDWSFQISHGYLKKPERAEPELDHIRRTTASAIYNKGFKNGSNWASTFVWGQNLKEGDHTNAYLFESDYSFGKNAIFGRLEQAEKDGHELVIPEVDPIHTGVFRVGSYSLGYVRDIVKDKGIDVGLGGMATFNTNPIALTPYYGGTKHSGWQVFLRFRPSKAKH